MSDGNTWCKQDISTYHSPLFEHLPIFDTLAQVALGGHLVWHEIIALHVTVTLCGAEFCPSCMQIHAGDSQGGTPNRTVVFPDAYNGNDPGIGILDPTVLHTAGLGAPYTFPRPPVSNIASPMDGDWLAIELFRSAVVVVLPAETDLQSAPRRSRRLADNRATQPPHGRLSLLYFWIARRHSLLLVDLLTHEDV